MEMRSVAPSQRSVHDRWMPRRLRKMESPEYREAWRAEQCGFCLYWVPLSGALGDDFGACTNAASTQDGHVQFEHDGCEAYVEGPDDASE
jgi:Protein of unknown function (DUF3027)